MKKYKMKMNMNDERRPCTNKKYKDSMFCRIYKRTKGKKVVKRKVKSKYLII